MAYRKFTFTKVVSVQYVRERYLNHVFLHTCALMTPKNGEKFIIRNEEKAREGISFGIKIIIQRLLAFF